MSTISRVAASDRDRQATASSPGSSRPGELDGEHLCTSMRGVLKPGAKTVTFALPGLVRDDPRTREEFLSVTGRRAR